MRRRFWVLAVAILLLDLLAYAPSIRFKYVQDSFHAVRVNPVVERGDVVEIFTSDYWKGTISPARTLYRPVTVLSFAVERKLRGESDPALAHLVNLLLHGVAAGLLALWARRCGAGDGAAALAGLLFTVHPVLLQAVVSVVGRADLLALIFSLGALLALSAAGPGRGRGAPAPLGARVAAWGAAGLVFAALGSKEIAIATPALMLAQEALFRRGRRDRAWWIDAAARLAPSALACTVWVVLRTAAIDAFPGTQPIAVEDNVLVGLHGVARWSTALAMAARYAGLLFWPHRLSPDYSGSTIGVESSWLAPLPMIGFAILGGLLLLAAGPWLMQMRRDASTPPGERADATVRAASMAAMLFLVPYAVVGNLLVLNAAGFAERLIYLPAAGFCVLVAVGVTALPRVFPAPARRAVLLVLAVALATALVGGALWARAQSRMWSTNATLFARALEVSPRSLRAYVAIAGDHAARGELDRALALYERALVAAPEQGQFWLDKGMVLARKGDLPAAESSIRRAIELDPTLAPARMWLGLLLRGRGDRVGADRALRQALVLNPSLLQAAAELGHLRFSEGRYEEAVHFYGGCVERGREDLRPNLAAARAGLARERRGPAR